MFAWKPEDMAGIPRSLIEHRLNINPSHVPIIQEKCIMTKERNEMVNKEVKDFVAAGFMKVRNSPRGQETWC